MDLSSVCFLVGRGLRIATGTSCPRNDKGFARDTVERADRVVRPYGWVASSVVGRDDVGIVPYAPFSDRIS